MLRCTDTLPATLYTAEGVRALDRAAIEHGVPGIRLMKRAGRAAFGQLLARWPDAGQLHVFCGSGNNGGDGYVVAALAAERSLPVQVIQVGDPARLKGEALDAYRYAEEAGVPMTAKIPHSLKGYSGVVVDAMLGTGLQGEVRPHYRKVIDAINASGLPVMAIDIPSGLCSDTGRRLGATIEADCTVTFIGVKRGLLTGDAPDYVGDLSFSDLQVPEETFRAAKPSAELLQLEQLQAALPPRRRTSHKGRFGHVLVVGGDYGMAGAVVLASIAAARTGAGLVSCATRPEHVTAVVSARPEVMAHGVNSGQELEPLLARATAIVVGPGLGRDGWGEQMLERVCAQSVPLVLDADALNLLAEERVLGEMRRDDWILTPHPGEAARLLQSDTATVQSDRFAAVGALHTRYGGAVVLKGAGSLIAGGSGTALCADGNPGMASGGMGDVLSGVLGGLLAQLSNKKNVPLETVARLGVCLHARAGDLAARDGERGTVAGDLISHLRALVNPE